MSLPAAIDYPAPITDLPINQAEWFLDRDRSAVLVHDLQRYFLRAFAEDCPALHTAIEQTARILRAARAAGVPVFYTAQRGNQDPVDRGLQGDLWGAGMSAIPEHTEIIEQVAPATGDVVLEKHRYSAFARSDLADRLAAAGRDQLIITGVYAHIGVTATAFEAFQREIHPFVVADGVADFGADQHRIAMQQVASCCGVVLLADAVVEAFSEETSPEHLLARTLARLIGEDGFAAATERPESDLFELGLDSMRAFEMLDELADAGIDIDFGEFIRKPSLAWLREQLLVPAA